MPQIGRRRNEHGAAKNAYSTEKVSMERRGQQWSAGDSTNSELQIQRRKNDADRRLNNTGAAERMESKEAEWEWIVARILFLQDAIEICTGFWTKTPKEKRFFVNCSKQRLRLKIQKQYLRNVLNKSRREKYYMWIRLNYYLQTTQWLARLQLLLWIRTCVLMPDISSSEPSQQESRWWSKTGMRAAIHKCW